MSTRMTRIWMAAAIALMGCGDDGGSGDGTTTGGACDPAVDARGNPAACITGALVDESGAPVVGIFIGACNADECIRTETDESGRYTYQGLQLVDRMMKVFGVPKGYMMTNWYQPVEPGVMAIAPDVKLFAKPGGEVALASDSGGTAVVGRLEITAGPDSLVYPIGEKEELEVYEVTTQDLPPFDKEPWAGKEADTLVFIVNPFAVTLDEPIELKVKGVGASAGTPYRIYSPDHITGLLEEGGSLVADEAGDLVLQPGARLEDLTTLIIVPN